MTAMARCQDGLDQIQFHSNPFEWKRQGRGPRDQVGYRIEPVADQHSSHFLVGMVKQNFK